jgi:hypothetical protein
VLEANTAQVNFAVTPVGTTSAVQAVTISNLGRQAANGLALSLSGPYGLAARVTTCGGTLAGKSSCLAGVTFTPTASGNQPGVLTATVSNLGVPPLTVTLDGTGLAVGGLSLTPAQMTFGSVVVKTASAAQTLQITNSGRAALTGVNVRVTGNYSLAGNTCSTTLAAGASCTTQVAFTPEGLGQQVGTGTVSTTSAGAADAVFSLVGYGIPAGGLSAVPTVASFGSETVGQTGPAQAVTLTNGGAAALAALKFTVAGDYNLTDNNCGTQLAGGATCGFMVSFAPGQPGTRIGSITITGTVQPSNSQFTPVVVGLTGNGLSAAQLTVTPAALAFGQVTVGSNSPGLQLTVTNPGTGALAGLSFATAPPFSAGSGTCGPTLAAGGSCGVPVVFSPAVSGSQSGAVTVASTTLGVPAVTVGVSGTGVLPASLSISPAALTFAGTEVGTTSAGQTVTVTNPGGVGLAGLTVAVSGDFTVGSTSCTGTLAAGASCPAVVTFTPSTGGGRTGFLTAASTTKGVNSFSAALSGTGLTQPVLGITPGQLTFGATLLGAVSATQMVTVTNSGQSPIGDLEVGVTAGFGMDPAQTTCTAALAGGASCVAGVLFAPAAAGAVTGAVTAGSAAAKVAATAVLSGIGALPPGIATTPAALVQFGTTGVGQAGQPVTVTVTNLGTVAALTGLTLSVDAAGTTAGFGLSANTCGTTLAAAASCTVQVTLTPKVAGALTGTLTLNSGNGGSTNLALAGIGFDFQFIVMGNGTQTVVQGQTAYYTLAVTPLGGDSGSFTFACGQLPANALCVFNPPQLGGLRATGNVQLGIGTGSAAAANAARWGGTMMLLCGVLAAPVGRWRRRRDGDQSKSGRAMLWMAVLGIAMISGLSSCAGSSGSGNSVSSGGGTHPGGGTPPASYPVTVTATAAGLSHSVQVTLVVN